MTVWLRHTNLYTCSGFRSFEQAQPAGKLREVALMLKAIHAQEDLPAAERKAADVVARLRNMPSGRVSRALGCCRLASQLCGGPTLAAGPALVVSASNVGPL